MTATPEKRPAFEPAERLLRPTGYDPDMPRPGSIVAGAVLVLLRAVAGAVIVVSLWIQWPAIVAELSIEIDGFSPTSVAGDAARWLVTGVAGAVVVIDLLLAVFIYRGANWARVLMMILTTFSITSSFVAWWAQGEEINLVQGTFVSLSLDILILLALSSRSSAAYARRNERR